MTLQLYLACYGLYTIFLSLFAHAYPHAPGTCNLELMATIGHGRSKSSCGDCYTISIQEPKGGSPYLFAITGPKEYQGFLAQVKNAKNETVGQFVNFDEDRFAPVVCEEEANRPLDWAGSIGHANAKLKSWPAVLQWDPSDDALGDLRLQGMVVMDYDNYDILYETPFKVKKRPSSSTSLVSAETETPVQEPPSSSIYAGDDESLQVQESPETSVASPLFWQTLFVILSLYIIMSLLHRVISRRRRTQ